MFYQLISFFTLILEDLDDSSYDRMTLAHLMSIANVVIVGSCIEAGPTW